MSRPRTAQEPGEEQWRPIDETDVLPFVHAPAGQSIGYFREVSTVAATMDRLVTEAEASLARFARHE